MKAKTEKNIGIGVAALLAISLSYVGVRAWTTSAVKKSPIGVQSSPTAVPQIVKATETVAPTLTPPTPSSSSTSPKPTKSRRIETMLYAVITCPNCGKIYQRTGWRDYICPYCGANLDEIVSGKPTVSGSAAPPGTSASPSAALSGSAGLTNALEEVDATLKKLDLGDIAFKVPERLPLRQHATVVLLLSPTQNAAQLTATLRQETATGEKVESAERIQISGLMEAKLAGPAFEIRAITPEEPQMVSRTEPTEWKWDVTPKQPGQQSLHLTINAIVKFDGANHPRTIRSFDRTIQVAVPAGFSRVSGLAKQKWMIIALIALVIVALGFLSWRREVAVVPSRFQRPLPRLVATRTCLSVIPGATKNRSSP